MTGAQKYFFALKAAVLDSGQLYDRAAFLASIGLPITLELHTFGDRDLTASDGRQTCLDNLARLRDAHGPLDLTVHVPLQKIDLVTRVDFDADQVADALGFAAEAGAGRVVLHRYWGLVHGQRPARARHEEATLAFNEVIRTLALGAPGLMLLVENVGHYSLLPRDGTSFVAGPLDHFFPWEIAEFRAFTASAGLGNVEAFVDVAHATLSANLFNWRRRFYRETQGDARFSAITDADLDRADRLHPFDFVDARMPYLHLSDSLMVDPADATGPDIPLSALISEGLELGTGNLPWAELPDRLAASPTDTALPAIARLVLEVEPGPEDNHVRNGAQHRSLRLLHQVMAGAALTLPAAVLPASDPAA